MDALEQACAALQLQPHVHVLFSALDKAQVCYVDFIGFSSIPFLILVIAIVAVLYLFVKSVVFVEAIWLLADIWETMPFDIDFKHLRSHQFRLLTVGQLRGTCIDD